MLAMDMDPKTCLPEAQMLHTFGLHPNFPQGCGVKGFIRTSAIQGGKSLKSIYIFCITVAISPALFF